MRKRKREGKKANRLSNKKKSKGGTTRASRPHSNAPGDPVEPVEARGAARLALGGISLRCLVVGVLHSWKIQKKKVFENSESALLLLFCFFFSFAPPCKSLAEHSGARGETERCLDSARSGREREIREERKREREAWSGRERKREGRFFLLGEASLTKRGKKKSGEARAKGRARARAEKKSFLFCSTASERNPNPSRRRHRPSRASVYFEFALAGTCALASIPADSNLTQTARGERALGGGARENAKGGISRFDGSGDGGDGGDG